MNRRLSALERVRSDLNRLSAHTERRFGLRGLSACKLRSDLRELSADELRSDLSDRLHGSSLEQKRRGLRSSERNERVRNVRCSRMRNSWYEYSTCDAHRCALRVLYSIL